MPASAQDSDAGKEIHSRIFGRLTVTGDQLVTLPEGLVGFPACHEFALLPAGPRGFSWLQSMDHETLALLLVDPFIYFPGYSIDVPAPVVARLDAAEAASISVQAVVTLGGAEGGATANLQGPVLFNIENRRGYQYVMQNTRFTTREPLVVG